MKLPRGTVGQNRGTVLASEAYLTVALVVEGRGPKPAGVGLLDLRPKPLLEGG